MKLFPENLFNLITLTLSQQTVIDKNAGQPLSDGWWKVDDSAKKVRLEQKFDLKKFRTPRLWFGLGCYNLEMETILLLEASSSQIIKNLSVRDKKEYSESQVLLLQKAEHEMAQELATSINCNLYVHHMLFDETDITSCLSYIERDPKL